VQEVNWTALIIFVLLFAFVTWLGFAAAQWRKGDLDLLHEWGLGGRRFGTVITWFLIGGDLYTAYTFIAVPALAFGAGAIAFFAVPYTIVMYPILFLVFPRLWHVCHKHHYITAADFVRGRFGNRWLALAVTIAGIVATMPYIALQLVGLQVVIGGLGVGGTGYAGDLPLVIAFIILAAFTYSSGLRAPASIAIVKDILIYITAAAAIIVVPLQLGGFGKIFAAVPPQKLLLAAPGANTTGAYGIYATLALGSALALFLYPHSLTGILSASSGHAIRRNAAMLPGYSLMLGLLALVGFFAIAAGVANLPDYTDGFKQFGNNFAVPALFLHSFPAWFVGIAFAAIGIGALVPAAIMSIARQSLHPQHPPRVHQQESDRQAGSADGEVGVAGGQVRRADLHHLRAVAIRHLPAAPWRHPDHPDAAGGDARRLYPLVQRLGAARRLGDRNRRRRLDVRRRQPYAELPAGVRRLHLPRLHGVLHRDPEPRDRGRALAAVQRHERALGPAR
jgi:solute:Na+ symporter, SSS family